MDFHYTPLLQRLFTSSRDIAAAHHNEFLTPEHLLLACVQADLFKGIVPLDRLEALRAALVEMLDRDLTTSSEPPEPSFLWQRLEHFAALQALGSQVQTLDITHYLSALYSLEHSLAAQLVARYLGEKGFLLSALIDRLSADPDTPHNAHSSSPPDDGVLSSARSGAAATAETEPTDDWHRHVTCINDHLDSHNPLIGRETELERTIRVLCRLDKNNPLHVGDPGVGKTALIYGLAALIRDGRVPERLTGARIYSLQLGSLLSGTQYRGQLEKRLLSIIDGMAEEGNAIAYIDEIHNLVGAGQTGEGSLDLANLLKPYLETGSVRFIGATTHEEYNRYFSKSGALVRRFQTIDVPEPSIEETCLILEGLRSRYESFHHVTFAEGVIEHAVRRAIATSTTADSPTKPSTSSTKPPPIAKCTPTARKP